MNGPATSKTSKKKKKKAKKKPVETGIANIFFEEGFIETESMIVPKYKKSSFTRSAHLNHSNISSTLLTMVAD